MTLLESREQFPLFFLNLLMTMGETTQYNIGAVFFLIYLRVKKVI